MYTVYILKCQDGTLYTGITTNLKKRFADHVAGTASKYTRAHKAEKLLYQETAPNRSSASKREASIKKLNRTAKLHLINTASQQDTP